MTAEERNARFGYTEENPSDSIKYKVVREFSGSTQTVLLKRGLSYGVAQTLARRYPQRMTSRVVVKEDV